MKKTTIFLFAFLFLSTAPTQGAGSFLKRAVLIPQWVPHAQFAGYYVALERGIYRNHGLDVTILSGGPDSPSLDFLREGKADFATLWLSTGIQARSDGVKLLNLAQVVQRSALMLVSRKSSGITVPGEIQGKKVGLWGPIFQVQPRAFFKKYGLDVRVVPQSFSVNLFLRGGVEVASAMWYNEYHTLLSSGIDPEELSLFFFHEHGLNFPEDGIYVLEEFFREDPELCRNFVTASLEGWRHAFAHPEETLDLVMRNLKKEYIPATRVHQKWMLERMKDLILPVNAGVPMGRLLREDYDRVAGILYMDGLIGEILDFKTFYTECVGHGNE
jgi:NitT/TauT family transport system substrate-binding protein